MQLIDIIHIHIVLLIFDQASNFFKNCTSSSWSISPLPSWSMASNYAFSPWIHSKSQSGSVALTSFQLTVPVPSVSYIYKIYEACSSYSYEVIDWFYILVEARERRFARFVAASLWFIFTPFEVFIAARRKIIYFIMRLWEVKLKFI